MLYLYKIFTLYDKYYKHDYYYLYVMTAYHFIIILYTVLFQIEMATKTFFVLSWDLTNHTSDFISIFSFKNVFFISLIFIIDFIFFIIVMKEFKSLKLSYKKIIILEIIILMLSFLNPTLRNIMYFLSLNTLQITIIYKFVKYVPMGKFLFLTGAYITLIKLILYPLIEGYKLLEIANNMGF